MSMRSSVRSVAETHRTALGTGCIVGFLTGCREGKGVEETRKEENMAWAERRAINFFLLS